MDAYGGPRASLTPIPEESEWLVVAEVILWATRTREAIAHDLGEKPTWEPAEPPDAPPGEDLTDYPPESRMSGAAASEAAAAAERVTYERDGVAAPSAVPSRPLRDVRESERPDMPS